MKIQIFGYSGSGKSTLAKILGEYYNIKPLHLDSINFLPNWKRVDDEIAIPIIKKELEKDDWIIDGNYYKECFERFEQADLLIFLKFNRFSCIKNAYNRYRKNIGKVRDDVAPDCYETFNLSFANWIMFSGRTKKHRNRYKEICGIYKSKTLIFNNRKELNVYINSHFIEK